MIIVKTRSEINFNVIVTRKKYTTLQYQVKSKSYELIMSFIEIKNLNQ